MQTQQIQLLTPHALSQRWGMNEQTLSQWRWRGFGPRFMKMGGKVLYRLQDVEEFEEKNIYNSTSQYGLAYPS